MAEPKLTRLAQLAAELPSMDDALDDLIARAHQVDSEAAQAWATESAEAAVRTGELDALRTQVAVLEKQLAAAADAKPADAKPKPADAKPVTPPPRPPAVSKPALPKLPAPPLFDARPTAIAPPRRAPWLPIGGAFAAGLVIALGVVAVTRSDDAPAPPPGAATATVAPAPPPTLSPPVEPTMVDKIVVPPPPVEPAAVASPLPTRKRVPAVRKASEPARDGALIDPFRDPHGRPPSAHAEAAPSPPASPARTPHGDDDLFSSRRNDPPRKPADAKPADAKPASDAPPRGELIDPFQSQ